MGDILSILIFAVVMIFSVWSSQKKKTKEVIVKPSRKNDESLGTLLEKLPCDKKHTLRFKEPDSAPTNLEAVVQKKQPLKGKTNGVTPDIASPPSAGIRFRTKEDAKRAFIYSEIFNRKY